MDRQFSMTDCKQPWICDMYMSTEIIAVVIAFVCRNRVVDNMRILDHVKDEYADVQIPLAVLE